MALEGELTPILVQMVKSANMNGLLDSDSDSLSSCQQRVKARLHEILQKDRDFTAEDYEKVGLSTSSLSLCLPRSAGLLVFPFSPRSLIIFAMSLKESRNKYCVLWAC